MNNTPKANLWQQIFQQSFNFKKDNQLTESYTQLWQLVEKGDTEEAERTLQKITKKKTQQACLKQLWLLASTVSLTPKPSNG